MNARTYQHTLKIIFLGILSITLIMGCAMIRQMPQTTLKAEKVTGKVEVLDESSQQWQPLENAQTVTRGMTIRTDADATVELRGADGSILDIQEATQVAIRAFEFDPGQQVRVAEFSVLQGTVTADAAHLAYTTNTFDVETPTVLASFKFSKATLTAGSQGNTDIDFFTGKFTFVRRAFKAGEAWARYILNDRIMAELSLLEDNAVEIKTTESGFRASNIGRGSLTIKTGGHLVRLSPRASITASICGRQLMIQNISDPPQAQVRVGEVLLGFSEILILPDKSEPLNEVESNI